MDYRFLAALAAALLANQTAICQPITDRFVELRYGNSTWSYDLSTVIMLQPGRFTIRARIVEDPEGILIKLKVLDVLRQYCDRPDGDYPPPPNIIDWTLVDMPVGDITVRTETKTSDSQLPGMPPYKAAKWQVPVKRLAYSDGSKDLQLLLCHGKPGGTDEAYSQHRQVLLDGVVVKELYDCDRAIYGPFVDVDDDPSKAILRIVPHESGVTHTYYAVCSKVTGKSPYLPPAQ
jgi:hypothetical protein